MTKEELIRLMEKWPPNTIVEISSFPFHAEIQAVQGEPEFGKALIVLDRESWKLGK